MKQLILVGVIIYSSCGKVDLVPTTSSNLMKNIKTFKGEKVVLLNVWALWCVPCVEEFPMIVDLGKQFEELEVVFISADFDDQIDEVEGFLKKKGVFSTSYIKKEKDESFIQGIHPNWTGSLPLIIVYAKKSGSIVDFWEGKEPESRFRTAINIAMNT